MKWLKRVPWFYILLTLFPLLYLWTANAAEVEAALILRPFLFTLGGSAALFLVLFLIFRRVDKAAWVGALLLVLFFSYGHVYDLLRQSPTLAGVGRHRYLVPLYLVVLGSGIWGILKHFKRIKKQTRWLNIFSILLVLMSAFQLGYFYISAAVSGRQSVSTPADIIVSAPPEEMPDVYFIVLDTYMRADALQTEMGFDNTAFIQQLEEMGFYVASCSRSNYGYTRGSIASTLNMAYLPELESSTGLSPEEDAFWAIIKNNEVRHQLQGIGYKMVAFQSEYPWLELTDADAFLTLDDPSIGSRYFYPFENMYLNSTAGVLWKSIDASLHISERLSSEAADRESQRDIPAGFDSYLQFHVDLQYFTLETLSRIPDIEGPKLVYAHFLVPHGPHVFGPDGQLVVPPETASGNDDANATGSEADRSGFLNGVQFINGQILPVLQDILENSKTPPIIILQGDHGYQDGNPGQYVILNAYYLPDGYADLYPSITPVNSFRIILNHYFGASYPLLPDASYDNSGSIPETFPQCVP